MNNLQVSIIIATFKRPDLLRRCLDRLAPGKQTVNSGNYEVIVADDDPQRSAIPVLQDEYPWVTPTYGPSKGPAAARNTAAAFAKAPLLIFTDDDCIPESTWVEGYLEAYEPGRVIVGKTTCKDGFNSPFEHAPVNDKGQQRFGCNLGLSREIFHNMGGFDEGYLKYGFEDYDFFRRCDQIGLKSVFSHKAAIDHPARQGPKAKQRIFIKINEYRYHLKFGLDISLSQQLRLSLAFFKTGLKRPGSLAKKLEYILDSLLYFVLLICYHERLEREAQKTLSKI